MGKDRLVALTGALQGRVFDIEAAVTVGRNPENSIQLDDLQVSRKHAVIERGPMGVVVKDLGSGNGTYIGTQRILEYKLKHGDVVRFGMQEFRYETDMPAPPPPPVAPPPPDRNSGLRFQAVKESNIQAANAAEVHMTLFQAPRSGASDAQLRETQRRLQAIYSANQIITSEQNLNKLFERVMDQIFQLLPAHNGVILMTDRESGELVTEYVKSGLPEDQLVISSTIVRRAFENGEAVITYDAADDDRFEAGASIIGHNISSAMCVPLTHQTERLGVIYVDTRGTTNAFTPDDREMLVGLSGPAAIAIKNAQQLRMIEQQYQDMLTVLATAIELRDHYTVGHTWRVTNISKEIARELGWNEEKIKEVQMGGVLHDIGKIAVDDAILRKPDRLTDEEYAVMKIHPERGAQLLRDVEVLHPLIPYCLYHHERWDGRGYPFGLTGSNIPIEGRIVAVADTFDAMTSNRPYRKGLDPEIAIAEIQKNAGSQFDPECGEALVKCYRSGKIDNILQDYHKTDSGSIACPFCSTHIRLPGHIQEGDRHECGVCHRTLLVKKENNTFFAALISQSEAKKGTPRLEYIGENPQQ